MTVKYGLWRIMLDLGEYTDEVLLYDIMLKDIVLSGHTFTILKEQIKRNKHYLSTKIIKQIFTPFNEDITSKSIFMLMSIFKGMAKKVLGATFKLLLTSLEDGGILLLGCSDPEASERKVLQVISTILDSPLIVRIKLSG